MTTYTDFTHIAPSTWNVSDVAKDNKGGIVSQSVWINNDSTGGDGGNKILFQLNTGINDMSFCPFGLSDPLPGAVVNPDKGDFLIDIENKDLLTFLTTFDTTIKEIAVAKSIEWFKRPVSMAEIEHMYCSSVKLSTNEKFAPKLKIKVNNKTKFETFKRNDTSIDVSDACKTDIVKKTKLMVAISVNRIWFMNKQFGVCMNASHVLIEGPVENTSPTEFFFGM